jgi:hypothetical protein
LVEHVEGLRRQVAAMEERLGASGLADEDNEERLSDAKSRLLRVCGMRNEELTVFASEVSSGVTATNQWDTLAGIKQRCRALAGDCMALEQRVGLRDNPRVAAAAAADRLAEEFSQKAGRPRFHYAVISDAEHYGADSSAIHLSYARLDVWNLNRAVHEFGHLWAEEFASGARGAQSAFRRSLGTKWSETQAKEFFADILAAFLTGPAFGYSCLLLDFSPADRRGSDTHPSDDERAYCILAALRELAKDFNPITRAHLNPLIGDLEQYWAAARTAAGAAGPPSNGIALMYAVGPAISSLKAQIPNAQYASLALANSVRAALAHEPTKRPENAGGADILNGAWLGRLEQPHDDWDIGRKALTMFAGLQKVRT